MPRSRPTNVAEGNLFHFPPREHAIVVPVIGSTYTGDKIPVVCENTEKYEQEGWAFSEAFDLFHNLHGRAVTSICAELSRRGQPFGRRTNNRSAAITAFHRRESTARRIGPDGELRAANRSCDHIRSTAGASRIGPGSTWRCGPRRVGDVVSLPDVEVETSEILETASTPCLCTGPSVLIPHPVTSARCRRRRVNRHLDGRFSSQSP